MLIRAPYVRWNLDLEKAKQLSDAIENSYWFEFFIGKLPELLLDSVDMPFNFNHYICPKENANFAYRLLLFNLLQSSILSLVCL